MRWYAVIVEADGVEIFMPDDDGPYVGLMTTRCVRATTQRKASEKAIAIVAKFYEAVGLQRQNRRAPPEFRVQEIYDGSLLLWLKTRKRRFGVYKAG